MKSSICVKIRQSGIKMSLFIQSFDSEIPALFEDNMFNGCISSISSGDASSILDMYGVSPKKYAHDTSKELSRILADQKKI
ncbi:hypothetical protein I3271_09170 [Photobacterium leiognathi]|uniref:hypothetical protein n=1 Tax=Photobacterium leiognathi TaxID=553611 RepID=UPI001EDCA070|nr:hypothetical protein [Photobacterium leiognathi]MCG3884859.1 hypothetical protein [Photobacterium leiognathi]